MVARNLPSGAECVRALLAAGFRVRHEIKGVTVLERDGRCVVVPDVATITPDMLASIARSAGLTQLPLRGAPSRSGTFTRFTHDEPPPSEEP